MSNRTWACVDCGITLRRDSSVTDVRCARCDGACERVAWKVRVPSPKQRREWDAFWDEYRSEEQLLAQYRAGLLREDVNLRILNRRLSAETSHRFGPSEKSGVDSRAAARSERN